MGWVGGQPHDNAVHGQVWLVYITFSPILRWSMLLSRMNCRCRASFDARGARNVPPCHPRGSYQHVRRPT
jgi:hypothetical protein